MKKFIIAIFLIGGINNLFAQIETKTYEKGKAFDKHPMFETTKQNSPEKKMPLFDVSAMLAEDEATKNLDLPFRFGKSFDVNLSLHDGKWTKNALSEVWSLKISSDNAYSLNFIFSELYLPKEGKLYIFNEEGTMVYGPVTEKQNEHGNTFLTDIIQGNSVTIQITVPQEEKEKTKLTVQNIIHGYKNIFSPVADPGYGQSQNCTDDVACWPQRNDESDGVVQILLSTGDELCSGALLNNTAQDFRPYVLTAFHCIDIGDPAIPHNPPFYYDPDEGNGLLEQYEIDEAEEWLVRFGFKHTECDGNTIGSIYTFDDTHYRAGWYPTDFALVELADDILRDVPSVGDKVWLGWDRSGNIPSSGVGIHHPSGDIMKLSVENNQFSISTWPNGLNNSHWLLNFDEGVVEHASSGSPIFDQNERIVGQLSGNQNYNPNQSYCDQPRAEYGRFHLSWDGGGDSTNQLSYWLNPLGGTVTTLNAVRPAPEYSGIPEQLCSDTSFSVTDLPPGYSFQQWNGSNVTFSNNTSNPVQVTPGSNGAGWVEAVVNTGWGNYTMERVYFWCGPPQFSYITGPTSTPNYQWATYYVEPYDTLMGLQSNNDYSWTLNPLNGNSLYNYGRLVDIAFYNSGSYQLVVRAENDCGFGPYTMASIYVYDAKSLSITPNPANGEVTVAIESTDKNELIVSEWDLEVFSETMLLKAKKTKLKGKSTTIQTSGWKEGIYMVRVKYKDEILTGKLIVKR